MTTQVLMSQQREHNMADPRLRLDKFVGLFLGLALMFQLVACAGIQDDAPDAQPQPALDPPPAATPNPVAEGTSATDETGFTDLVLWLPDFYDLDPAHTAGDTLYTVRNLFEQTYPGVYLTLANKAESGQAGIFNFLRAAQRAAPGVMPDAVILNTQDLWQAVDHGLVQPVDPDFLNSIDDFYPFALDAVTYKETLYGVPISADILHLVYNRTYGSEIRETVPITTSAVLSDSVPFIFAAGHRNPAQNLFLLLAYVGGGGVLGEDGALSRPEGLGEVYEFLAAGRQAAVIPDTVLGFSSEDAVWAAFLEGDAGLAAVNARYYLSQGEVLDNIGFGSVPTLDGTSITVAQTWAFAILTPDPERQALIIELVQELLDPEVLGPVNQYNHRLPTRRSAFQLWSQVNPYYQFLDTQLGLAVAIPNGKAFADLAQRMQQAELDVLSGNLQPAEALLNLQPTP